MRDLSRREFLRYGAAAVATPALLDLVAAPGALAATTPLPPPTDLKTLATKAQAEGGSLTVYFASADLATPLASGFNAQYPWATANVVLSNTAGILSKVLTEVTAGHGADAFIYTSAQKQIYINAGAAAPVALVSDANLGASTDKTGYGHAYALTVQGLISNPSLASYVPKDIFQLANPAYKGQFAMDLPDGLGAAAFFLASHRRPWGDKKWMLWLEGLHNNNVFITSSSTGSYQAVLTGERGICVDSTSDYLTRPAGAPVSLTIYQGTPRYGQGVMKASYAAHPNMAELFMNFMLSKAGQEIVVQTGRTPAMDIPGAATAVSTLFPKGQRYSPNSWISGFLFNPTPYTKIWDQFWHA